MDRQGLSTLQRASRDVAAHGGLLLPEPGGRARLQAGGDGLRIVANEPEIGLDESNLVYRAMHLVYKSAGKQVPGLELGIDNAIPLSRGLGSSAAAISAGLVLANALLGEPTT